MGFCIHSAEKVLILPQGTWERNEYSLLTAKNCQEGDASESSPRDLGQNRIHSLTQMMMTERNAVQQPKGPWDKG